MENFATVERTTYACIAAKPIIDAEIVPPGNLAKSARAPITDVFQPPKAKVPKAKVMISMKARMILTLNKDMVKAREASERL